MFDFQNVRIIFYFPEYENELNYNFLQSISNLELN